MAKANRTAKALQRDAATGRLANKEAAKQVSKGIITKATRGQYAKKRYANVDPAQARLFKKGVLEMARLAKGVTTEQIREVEAMDETTLLRMYKTDRYVFEVYFDESNEDLLWDYDEVGGLWDGNQDVQFMIEEYKRFAGA